MKYVYSILWAWMMALSSLAQSGKDYNPENPADPSVYYTLTREASPRNGGNVDTTRVQAEIGDEVYCRAEAKLGYAFKQWMMGDSLVSTDASFYFKMPAENVVLIAYFDYVGYNPENPSDPGSPLVSHDVMVYANPSAGGSFNSSKFRLKEGETTRIYAYPKSGYRFESWIRAVQWFQQITL